MAQRQPAIVPGQAEIAAERASAQRKLTQLASLPRTAPLDRTRLSGLSRAAWTPRERRLGRVDRGSRRAADGALPTARKSSPVAAGVEVFCGIMRLSRIGERLKLFACFHTTANLALMFGYNPLDYYLTWQLKRKRTTGRQKSVETGR